LRGLPDAALDARRPGEGSPHHVSQFALEAVVNVTIAAAPAAGEESVAVADVAAGPDYKVLCPTDLDIR